MQTCKYGGNFITAHIFVDGGLGRYFLNNNIVMEKVYSNFVDSKCGNVCGSVVGCLKTQLRDNK